MARVDVRPELLTWAVVRSGLSDATLARRFPKLEQWIEGATKPTLRQLESFATATFTSIGYLLLDAPPAEGLPIPDFRTVADRQISRPSPHLLDTVYLCQQRQDWFRDYVRTQGEPPLSMVGSARVGDDVVATAARIRHAIGFDVAERRVMGSWDEALRRFIQRVDERGILVMVSGVVGSNTRRRLSPQEFRGFALADDRAPLIFLNGADSKAAQMFTLAHELAHIWLGQSGVSDATALVASDHVTENWCNRVAAELLVPMAELIQALDSSAVPPDVQALARRFKVSTLVVLRRLHDAGRIGRDAYWQMYEAEVARVRALPKGSGGDFYLTLGARASKTFSRAIVGNTLEGATSFTEAFRLLGFRKTETFYEAARQFGLSA
jgi:Zn-dependent peptidase ImmA (M78 family)